jgi:hypothetical protein
MKKCSICCLEKTLSDFTERKLVNGNIGHRGQCKDCRKDLMKKNYRIRQDKLNSLETVLPEIKKCGKCKIEKSSDSFYKNSARTDGLATYCIKCCKNYYSEPKWVEYDNKRNKKRSLTENYIEYQKGYRKKNMSKFVEKNYEKYHNDPMQRLKQLYRNRIRKVIDRKRIPSQSILGCSWETFKEHIESKFTEQMNWDNHGQFGWHLDHIIPLASAKTEDDLYKLNHYTNIQPLWWRDNIIKGDKILEGTNK